MPRRSPRAPPSSPFVPAEAGTQLSQRLLPKNWVPASAGMNGVCCAASILRQRLQMPDRPARRDGLRRGDNGIRIDAVMLVELGQRAGLAEMLDAERARAMAGDGAEPGKRRRMAVDHSDDAAMRRHIGKQTLDMRARMHQPALAY